MRLRAEGVRREDSDEQLKRMKGEKRKGEKGESFSLGILQNVVEKAFLFQQFLHNQQGGPSFYKSLSLLMLLKRE